MKNESFVHPYIPNTVETVRKEMLDTIGIKKIEDLYQDIPQAVKIDKPLDLPAPILSECELKQHVEKILTKNKTCAENLNFLGAGCYQHHIPAVCNEIANRGEFVTAYDAGYYADQGKYQAMFEYLSMMAELLDTDVVSITYDGLSAISSSLLMASRITGRKEALIVGCVSKDKKSHINNFCRPVMDVTYFDYDCKSGEVDLKDLEKKISDRTACVFFESPSYLGVIETQGEKVAKLAHKYGALCVVSVNPLSLGVLAAPASYGADITCGDVQPLGLHMNYGGGLCGFISTSDDQRFLNEHPSPPLSVFPEENGDLYFGKPTKQFSSYIKREKSPDFTGSLQTLSSITAGVYLATMGPKGMQEIGTTIMQKAAYGRKLIGAIKGVRTDVIGGCAFDEFVVDFNGTGKTVEKINKYLLKKGIFGGKDLSKEFPELGQSALFCITEVHSASDIELLAETLREAVK